MMSGAEEAKAHLMGRLRKKEILHALKKLGRRQGFERVELEH